ncbi:MAG: hypothetical protein J0H20_07130, partial [Rhizobiales bacterium]|nr:hypothetical protein [Hyphomicrobiales bacterium]
MLTKGDREAADQAECDRMGSLGRIDFSVKLVFLQSYFSKNHQLSLISSLEYRIATKTTRFIPVEQFSFSKLSGQNFQIAPEYVFPIF